MKIQALDNSPNFSRKPNTKEMKIYTSSVEKGLKLLGKEVDLILHNSSAPTVKSENTGIGSLFSRTVQTKLIPFLKSHGFSNIQQEPNNLRQVLDNSPYAPEASAKNIFMIPLEKLASDEYKNILSQKTLQKIVNSNPRQDVVRYPYVRVQYEKALKEAYGNAKNDSEFSAKLIQYKKENESRLEQSAIYRILGKIHGNDNLAIWENKNDYSQEEIKELAKKTGYSAWSKLDKNLYTNSNDKKAQARIQELKTNYKEDYDFYFFQQMILDEENKKSNELAKRTGIKIIGDSPVALSSVEEWVNQNLFLKGKAIGCPPDYFSKTGQRWGFKYFDPDKIFNKDGSLGEAGKVLQKKYEDYFASFPGGIRIDHIIGLIDPFIYTESSKKMTTQNSGRIFSTFFGKYQKNSIDEYAALLTKIVIPAAEKYGLDKSSIICEDLGDRNIPTEKVMKKLELLGIKVTRFDHRGAKAPKNSTIMLGSHDNSSYREYVDELLHDRKHFMKKTRLLAEDTAPMGATKEEKKKYLDKIRSGDGNIIEASFAELFCSPARKIQIFFTDFWGLRKTYNKPGTTQGNWSLRLGENFEDDYYKAVANQYAPNIPKLISIALRNRGLDKENKALMKNLENSAKILAE